jgi:alkanesulfonate monooxygenase SsuD/methylene tetrahydromethanopterin reductase-like flavin-dependent oxidoreductase (luciferase family)
VQTPHPPIVFGGESDTALKRAATLGDGWYGVGHTPQSAGVQVARLRTLLAEAGRSDHRFEITVSHAGEPLSAEHLAHYAAAGVHRVVTLPWRRGREAEDALQRLAERVLA